MPAICKAVIPRHYRSAFLNFYHFSRVLSMIPTVTNSVSGHILNLQCSSASQSTKYYLYLSVISIWSPLSKKLLGYMCFTSSFFRFTRISGTNSITDCGFLISKTSFKSRSVLYYLSHSFLLKSISTTIYFSFSVSNLGFVSDRLS